MTDALNFSLTEDHRMVQQSVEEAMQPWTKGEHRAELRRKAKVNEFSDELCRAPIDVYVGRRL